MSKVTEYRSEYDSFDDMEEFFSEELLQGINEYGFEHPSRIQRYVMQPFNLGKDIIAQSQSGTGKTGAFTIGTLTKIDPSENFPQAIIVSDTHELAIQTLEVIKHLSKHMKINIVLCVGGKSGLPRRENITKAKTAHILVGTPGRLVDLIEAKAFNPKNVKTLVLDEADNLLSHGFTDQVRSIIVNLSSKSQITIFSATYTPDITDLANQFMKDPFRTTIKQEEVSLDQIVQYKVEVEYDDSNCRRRLRRSREDIDDLKFRTLEDIYKTLTIGQCMIFVNRHESAEHLSSRMIESGHQVGVISGKMDGVERERVLREFRVGDYRALISTDVLARGIDVQQIGIVFNFDLPRNPSQYIHRIGRSGRYGKRGVAINLVSNRDNDMINRLISMYKKPIDDMPDPTTVNRILLGDTMF